MCLGKKQLVAVDRQKQAKMKKAGSDSGLIDMFVLVPPPFWAAKKSFATHDSPVQQILHIPTVVANEVDVDCLLSDFVDDAVHAGYDLAILAGVQCMKFFGHLACVGVGLQVQD